MNNFGSFTGHLHIATLLRGRAHRDIGIRDAETDDIDIVAPDQLLQQHLRAHPSAPPLQLGAPGDARLRDLFVRPHDLHPYDHLQLTIEEESDVP